MGTGGNAKFLVPFLKNVRSRTPCLFRESETKGSTNETEGEGVAEGEERKKKRGKVKTLLAGPVKETREGVRNGFCFW